MKNLIEALRVLPGVGEKSAQRMAYHLMQHDRQGAALLANRLTQALTALKPCSWCNNYTEELLCSTCSNPKRDSSLLCVVEMPIDQMRIEQTHVYQGLYFVLMGRISPISGHSAEHVSLQKLRARCQEGTVKEVVLATSFTQEGETTAYAIAQQLHALNIPVTRLARGVPAGAELEYLDASTLAHALWDRRSA